MNVRRMPELGILKITLFFVKDQMQSLVKAAGGFTLISVGTGLGF